MANAHEETVLAAAAQTCLFMFTRNYALVAFDLQANVRHALTCNYVNAIFARFQLRLAQRIC